MSDDILHDVENSMRQERLERLWKEYGPYLIGGVVLAVLLTGALTAWRSHQAKLNAQNTATLIQALDQKDPLAAINGAVGDLKPSHQAIAHLTAAGLALRDNKTKDALTHYRALADDGDAPALYRDLAILQAARLEWQGAKEKATAERLSGQIEPIAEDEENPWHWQARISLADIRGHGLQRYDDARALLAPLVAEDSQAPQSLRERAAAMDAVFAVTGSDSPATPAAPTTPAATAAPSQKGQAQ